MGIIMKLVARPKLQSVKVGHRWGIDLSRPLLTRDEIEFPPQTTNRGSSGRFFSIHLEHCHVQSIRMSACFWICRISRHVYAHVQTSGYQQMPDHPKRHDCKFFNISVEVTPKKSKVWKLNPPVLQLWPQTFVLNTC